MVRRYFIRLGLWNGEARVAGNRPPASTKAQIQSNMPDVTMKSHRAIHQCLELTLTLRDAAQIVSEYYECVRWEYLLSDSAIELISDYHKTS